VHKRSGRAPCLCSAALSILSHHSLLTLDASLGLATLSLTFATILSLDAFRPRAPIRAVATLLPLGAVWSPFGASRRLLLAALQAFHARWRRRRGLPLRRRRVLLRRRGGLR